MALVGHPVVAVCGDCGVPVPFSGVHWPSSPSCFLISFARSEGILVGHKMNKSGVCEFDGKLSWELCLLNLK